MGTVGTPNLGCYVGSLGQLVVQELLPAIPVAAAAVTVAENNDPNALTNTYVQDDYANVIQQINQYGVVLNNILNEFADAQLDARVAGGAAQEMASTQRDFNFNRVFSIP